MSNLSTLKTLLTQKLATTSTGFQTSPNRTAAINEAILKFALQYDIPELIRRGTQTFTSGVGAFPTSFLRMIKMWDATTPTNEYLYILPDDYDAMASTEAYYWTIDYNVSASARKILVLPTSTTSANIRYMVTPTTLSSDSDECQLPSMYDEAIALKACGILLKNERDPMFQVMDKEADGRLKTVIQAITPDGGVKAYNRLRSVYEKLPLLQGNG